MAHGPGLALELCQEGKASSLKLLWERSRRNPQWEVLGQGLGGREGDPQQVTSTGFTTETGAKTAPVVAAGRCVLLTLEPKYIMTAPNELYRPRFAWPLQLTN